MTSQPLVARERLSFRDVVALVTTVCLVGTLGFVEWKLMPTYAAALAAGGQYQFPRVAGIASTGKLLIYASQASIVFGLYLLFRAYKKKTVLAPLMRVLPFVNALAVVVLMTQTAGVVTFARHANWRALATAHEHAQPAVRPAGK